MHLASEMTSLMGSPAAKETVQKTEDLALVNACEYRKSMPLLPWNEGDDPERQRGGPRWPACPRDVDATEANRRSAKIQFNDDFWLPGEPVAKARSGLKGHFVKLPLNWTRGENNHPTKMSVMAVSMAAPPADSSLASEGTADV